MAQGREETGEQTEFSGDMKPLSHSPKIFSLKGVISVVWKSVVTVGELQVLPGVKQHSIMCIKSAL